MSFGNLTGIYRSASFRLTGIFMLVFVMATLIIVGLTYAAMERYLEDQAYAFVDGLILDNLDFFEEFGIDSLALEIDELSALDERSRQIYVLFDQNCEVIAGAPDRLPEEFVGGAVCGELEGSGGVRVFDLPHRTSGLGDYPEHEHSEVEDDEAIAKIEPLPDGGWLLVVLIVPEIEDTREFLVLALGWAVTLLFAVGLAGAILLTQAVSRRLEKVNSMSRDIRQGDLSRRIPLDGSGDEFDKLSTNLNAMLDRIEQVIEGSRQVTNDIAHDLRTPLTRIQTHIETLRARLEGDRETADQLDRIADESRKLLDMFNALLRIAGIESGGITRSFQDVDLSEVCRDALELLEPLAGEKGISLAADMEGAVIVNGDRNLLFQSVTNVMENAIKYSPESSAIRITLKKRDGGCVFRVRDNGPGIPDDMQEKVFQRFYRLERHRGASGYGLGLSLVRAVVDIHQGTIDLESGRDGLSFAMRFSCRNGG